MEKELGDTALGKDVSSMIDNIETTREGAALTNLLGNPFLLKWLIIRIAVWCLLPSWGPRLIIVCMHGTILEGSVTFFSDLISGTSFTI